METSEGMLSLPLFNQVKELKRIAFWRGEGGRQFMMQQCQARHIDVLNFILYDRAFPQQTQAQFLDFVNKIEQFEKPYWSCISSEASWHNWLALTRDRSWIKKAGSKF